MKLKGKKIDSPNIEIIVLPRPDEDLVFKAQAVLDRTDFDKLCPMPLPPKMLRRDGIKIEDVEDKGYKAALTHYNKNYMNWLIIQSLKATEELEWETIDFSNPDTWGNYEKEWKESCLSDREQVIIISGVMAANSLSDEKINEARKRFFTMDQLAKQTPLSQEVGLNNMPSGELASV